MMALKIDSVFLGITVKKCINEMFQILHLAYGSVAMMTN